MGEAVGDRGADARWAACHGRSGAVWCGADGAALDACRGGPQIKFHTKVVITTLIVYLVSCRQRAARRLKTEEVRRPEVTAADPNTPE